jgi:hypothetical protein
LDEERVPVMERPPVRVVRVRQLALAAEFVLASREVRCLFTDVFRRWGSYLARMFVGTIGMP